MPEARHPALYCALAAWQNIWSVLVAVEQGELVDEDLVLLLTEYPKVRIVIAGLGWEFTNEDWSILVV